MEVLSSHSVGKVATYYTEMFNSNYTQTQDPCDISDMTAEMGSVAWLWETTGCHFLTFCFYKILKLKRKSDEIKWNATSKGISPNFVRIT